MDAIVRLSALGDIIHTAIILEFIPEVNWIVEERFAQILEYHPKVTIHSVNLKSLKQNKLNIFSEYKKLKQLHFDRSIDFQGLIKSAIVSKIIANEVIGRDDIRENLAKIFYTKKLNISTNHTIDRYREMINKIYNLNITQEQFINHKPFLYYKDFNTKEFFSQKKKNIVFIIGSSAKNRLYPTKKWIELAKNLNENILIPFGNEIEEKMAFEIAENADVKVLPKMNLNDLKATISNADLVIGNDTGPTYIGWANNIPTILLFGTTPISRMYENKTTKIIKSKTAKYLNKLDKTDFSINDIEVYEIMEKIDELFS